jgi:hypothetical protein
MMIGLNCSLHTSVSDYEDMGFQRSPTGRLHCDQCEAVSINGLACHETGCPNAKHECNGCTNLIPVRQRYCEDCQ